MDILDDQNHRANGRGGLFEFVTGVLNVQLDYVFPGSFYPLHFYGAWVFFAAFVAHAVLKTPMALRNLRRMRQPQQLPEEERELVSPDPDPPTVSRRGALGLVGGGSLLLFGTTLPGDFDLGVNSGVTINANDSGSGHHAEIINSASVTHKIFGPLSAYAEFWSAAGKSPDPGWRQPPAVPQRRWV